MHRQHSTIRFLTNNSVDDADTVYIDNVSIKFLKYPQCYITRIDPASVPSNYTLTTAGTERCNHKRRRYLFFAIQLWLW